MGYAIDTIEGIGPAYRAKLVKVGIRTTDGLLKQCCDKKGRRQIADAADCKPHSCSSLNRTGFLGDRIRRPPQ